MEEPSSTISYTDDDSRNLKMLLETFGSMVSLQAISSAYCEAQRNVYTAAELLCNYQESTSTSESLGISSDDDKLPEKNNIEENYNLAKTNNHTTSIGTVSSIIGRDYSKPKPLANEASKESTKPLKMMSSEIPASVMWGDDNGTGEESMHKELEDFMFKMLGEGFQLDKNVIHNVLGLCGYNVQKSMKELLDLSAITLGKSDDVLGATAQTPVGSSVELGAFENQQKLTSGKAKSGPGSSKQDVKKSNLEKDILRNLFFAPPIFEEQPKIVIPARKRSSPYMVTEPFKDEIMIPDRKTVTVKHKFTADDDDSENSYEELRKSVKQYWSTMREYYEAAVNAFAEQDLLLAYKLLEKGHFFKNKARIADEKSAQILIQNRDEVEEMCIDLQDHDPKDAIRNVKIQLPNLCGIPSIQYLKLVIGTDGSNPKEVARKRQITKLLEKVNVKWTEEGDGWMIVIKVDEINPKSLKF
jgi:hypothetical protein